MWPLIILAVKLLFDFHKLLVMLLFMEKHLSRDVWPWLNVNNFLTISPQEFVIVTIPHELLKKIDKFLVPIKGSYYWNNKIQVLLVVLSKF